MKLAIRLFVILLCVCISATVYGTPAYQMISDIGSSAEMISIGNIEGFSKTSNSIFENPAALTHINIVSAALFSTTIMQEVSYNNLSVAYNSPYGVFGLGYMSAGVDGLPITAKDSNNYIINTGNSFSYKNHIIKLGYAYPLTHYMNLGVASSLYSNKIHTITCTGIGLDVGLFTMIYDIGVSVFARNVAPTKVTYKNSSDPSYSATEKLPLHAVGSLSYPFLDFNLFGQVKYDSVNPLISMGVSYQPSLLKFLKLSAGYKEFSVLKNIKSTTSFGAGLSLYGINLDYAYEISQHIEYNSNSYFSIGLSF